MRLYKESFILYNDEESSFDMGTTIFDEFQTELAIFRSFEDIQDALSMVIINDITFAYPAAIHGVITPVTSIPKVDDGYKTVSAWIMQIEMELESERFDKIYTASLQPVDMIDLESAVTEKLITLGEETESTFIVYGSEITVCHAIDEEDCNESILNKCKKIGEEVRSLAVSR